MQPYQKPMGKGNWASFWNDKVPKKIKRIFKKSIRQQLKKIDNVD